MSSLRSHGGTVVDAPTISNQGFSAERQRASQRSFEPPGEVVVVVNSLPVSQNLVSIVARVN